MGREVTPSDLTITPRDRRFGRGGKTERWWLGGNPYGSALYDALSITFPKGEAFFVESVRAFRDGAPPKLAEEIKRLHHPGGDAQPRACRVQPARDRGRLRHDPARAQGRRAARGDQGPAADRQPRRDHGARAFHRHPRQPAARQSAPSARRRSASAALWRWHSMEEIEHKGVAYDTWLHATRDWPRRKRWTVKSMVMLKVTKNFFVERTQGALMLLRQDGITGPRAWAGLLWYAFIYPGMFGRSSAAGRASSCPASIPGSMTTAS
jgi:predicted metal-dependent hydrolase